MRRLSPFERDYRDLHGRPPAELRVEIVQPMPPRRWRGVDHPGLRLTVGLLGLFWGGVGLVLLAAAVFAVVAALWPGQPAL